MKLFASGCSFTWGGELIKQVHDTNRNILDENNTSDLNLHRLNITWPKHLSDFLGCTEFHNHAMGCGSNPRIVRKTLDFFTKKINNNEDMSDWVAVIQWTEPSRFEFYDDSLKTWVIVKHDVIITEKSYDSEFIRPYVNLYYKYNEEKQFGSQLFSQVVSLGNFFKQHNIRYVFTTISESFFTSVFDEEKMKYCKDNFVWYNDDMMNCSISNMGVERCITSPHPSELGHKQVAEHIGNFFNKKFNFSIDN